MMGLASGNWGGVARLFFAVLAAIGVVLPASGASGPGVVVSWLANPERDVAGYKVYYGLLPRGYTVTNDVGLTTNVSLELPGGGVSYHFAVTAYNSNRLESGFSEDVHFVAPPDARPVSDEAAIQVATLEDVSVEVPWRAELGGGAGWMLVSRPLYGTLDGPVGRQVYVPHPDVSGTDTFEYVNFANPTRVRRVKATVSITPVDDAPAADDALLLTWVGEPVVLEVPDKDPDGDKVYYWVTRGPRHGLVAFEERGAVYTPLQSFQEGGVDTWSYVATDGRLPSREATVTVTVERPNLPPTAQNLELRASRGSPILIRLSGTDPEAGPLEFFILSGPSFGDLEGDPPELLYTPWLDSPGEDAIEYAAVDADGAAGAARVTITIGAPNQRPVAGFVEVETDAGVGVAVPLSGLDPDGDPLSFRILDWPEEGDLSGAGDQWWLVPPDDYQGVLVFTYVASDGLSESLPGTVSVWVTPSRTPPALSIGLENGRPVLIWRGLQGRTYRVWCTAQLAAGSAEWGLIAEVFAEQTGTVRWPVPESAGSEPAYYRLELLD